MAQHHAAANHNTSCKTSCDRDFAGHEIVLVGFIMVKGMDQVQRHKSHE
jgi:hypothetical protein